MSELSAKARELVSAGRGALRPSDADRQRVLDALQSRLAGATLGSGDASAPLKSAPAKSGWAWLAIGLVGAGVVGTILALALRPDAPRVSSVSASVPAPSFSASEPPAVVEPTEPVREPEPVLTAAPSAAAAPPPPSSRRAPDRLAEEVAIVGRAAADLRAGRPADALSALNEHQSKFPKGALVVERRAARAEALCSLGRVAEARAELARLPKGSPQAVRAADFCAKRGSD